MKPAREPRCICFMHSGTEPACQKCYPPVCKHFIQGTCKFGDQCRFSHELPDCRFFDKDLQSGCTRGSKCKFVHPPRPVYTCDRYSCTSHVEKGVKYCSTQCERIDRLEWEKAAREQDKITHAIVSHDCIQCRKAYKAPASDNFGFCSLKCAQDHQYECYGF